MSGTAEGFGFEIAGDGSVRVSHHGRVVSLLRGRVAERFLEDVRTGDAQQLMARVTGNYRRGNERVARQHPRNNAR